MVTSFLFGHHSRLLKIWLYAKKISVSIFVLSEFLESPMTMIHGLLLIRGAVVIQFRDNFSYTPDFAQNGRNAPGQT